MAYSEKVIDHYENPRNVGGFDKNDPTVATGMVGAPGCGSAIASSSLVTEWVKGKSIDEAVLIKNTHIAEELALPPVKIHCSILAEDAIKAAVADYKKKHSA
jgi:nitrogen fixation NifU-like protein